MTRLKKKEPQEIRSGLPSNKGEVGGSTSAISFIVRMGWDGCLSSLLTISTIKATISGIILIPITPSISNIIRIINKTVGPLPVKLITVPSIPFTLQRIVVSTITGSIADSVWYTYLAIRESAIETGTISSIPSTLLSIILNPITSSISNVIRIFYKTSWIVIVEI